MTSEWRQVQCFPSGTCHMVWGKGGHMQLQIDPRSLRVPTAAERREIEVQEVADLLWGRECYCLDSSLVTDLMAKADGLRQDDPLSDFSFENVEGLRPDYSGFSDDELYAALSDAGLSPPGRPDGDDGATDEEWRGRLEAMTDEIDEPEIFEWWRVSDWYAERLLDAGEAVLRNDYGNWWGRCCTGQAVMMDGTLQKVAAALLDKTR